MTKQTITARRANETRTFKLNYRSLTARVVDSKGVRRMSLEAAMTELRSLPEQGWICR